MCDAYVAERDRKNAAEKETARDAARSALDTYRTNVFRDMRPPSMIAFAVSMLASGSIVSRPRTIRSRYSCTYNVLINNQSVPVLAANPAPGTPSFKSTLSAGDRNTLALAIFFASLKQDANLTDKIIVIDDPISSLDDHRAAVALPRDADGCAVTQQAVPL